MNSEQYINSINGVISDLEKGKHANIMVQIANTALQMIHSRVVDTGINANGQKFGEYSDWYKKYKQTKGKYRGFVDFSFTTRMWTNIQLIKEKTTENMAVITARDKGTTGSYETVPVKKHSRKQTKVINRKIFISEKPIAATKKSIYVPTNYEKLSQNSERFGRILELSKEEIETLKKQYDMELLQIFSNHGLR